MHNAVLLLNRQFFEASLVVLREIWALKYLCMRIIRLSRLKKTFDVHDLLAGI